MYTFLEIVVFCLALLYAYSAVATIINAAKCMKVSDTAYSDALNEGFSKSLKFGQLTMFGILILNLVNLS